MIRYILPLVLAGGPAFGATIVSNIHNAPGWQHTHSYTFSSAPPVRVNNGPGWTEGAGTYTPGAALNSYQLTSLGTCTSAAAGGPTGTGTAITDGTCTWKYVSGVDYISITGWAFDNAPWIAGTYAEYRYVRSGTKIYELYPTTSCSSTIAPTGTGSGTPPIVTTPDGCSWVYWADIIYSSNVSYMPTQTFDTASGDRVYNLTANYQANLWNDREYVAGSNGENVVIGMQAHMDFTDDINYGESDNGPYCPNNGPCFHIIVTAAPGESFADKLTQYDPLTGYNQANGVAIHSTQNGAFNAFGFQPRDNFIDFIGVQIKADYGSALNAAEAHSNNTTIRNSILEGSGSEYTLEFDLGPCVLANSLVISHSTNGGVFFKYPAIILHSTIVSPDHIAGSIGIASNSTSPSNPTPISNTAVFGFAHAAAHLASGGPYWGTSSSHNATDVGPNDNSTTVNTTGFFGAQLLADPLPGGTYSVPMSKAFVNPTTAPFDWRLANASPLRQTGSAYGSFETNCDIGSTGCPWSTIYNFDSPNIIGLQRPQSGLYNIGAW